MKITVIIEYITLEVDMPHAKSLTDIADCVSTIKDINDAILNNLVKTTCTQAIELYKAKRA